MTQVLLINPRSDFLQDPAFAPPLGLLYVGTAIENQGFEVKVADLNLTGSKITGYDPFLIGVTCVTANFAQVGRLIEQCHKVYPRVPVVVGGPHVSVRPWDYEKLGATWSIDGDGEDKVAYLASTLRNGFNVAEGRIPDWSVVDVNQYPYPARHLVPIRSYSCTLDGEPATTLVGQRGCPMACAFCSRWNPTRIVRPRSTDNVIHEIRELRKIGFRSLVFHDDEVNVLHGRLMDLCKNLESEGIRFKANIRADLLTKEQAKALKRAGCSWLCVGVESGSSKILKTVRKGTTPEINSRARNICREAGIKFKAFVIIGLPGETPETAEETRRWLVENEVDDLTVTMFVPFPGSDIYEHPGEYDINFELDYENAPMPFRGAAGLNLPHTTRTAGLSAEELARLPEWIEASVRKELGINHSTAGRTL